MMVANFTLQRREAVKALLADRKDLLVVTGLGSRKFLFVGRDGRRGDGRPRYRTCLRQYHAAAVPGKEFGAQLMLEKLDLTAERRLRYPQGVGGFAEAPEFRNATECSQLSEIHACQSWNAS